MPLPVNVTIENCNATVASTGQTPIDGAVQWQDPPTPTLDWPVEPEVLSGEDLEAAPATDAILDLGAKGTFACYLGSMATQTTIRVHCPGVPLAAGERVTGSITSGSVATTKFALAGDGLAILGADRPDLEFGTTAVTATRTQLRDYNPLREVQELDGRNATYGVYHQWRLVFWPGRRRVGFTCTMSFTDERLNDRVLAWPRVRIRIPAAWDIHVENAARCPGTGVYLDGAFRYWDVVAAHTIHDAQSAQFHGTFLIPGGTNAEIFEWIVMPGNRVDVPRMICDPEEFRGKLFFYEGLPAVPTNFEDASCRDRYNRFAGAVNDRRGEANDYTRRPYLNELNARARDAGAQYDFAHGPFYECFVRDGGNPLRLPELDATGERHMSRPITQRRRGLDEVDTNNARTIRWGDYVGTDFVLEGEYINIRASRRPQDPDVRGKSTTGANATQRFFGRMTGLLRSHISFWHALESWFLTGCFDAEDIVRQHIELFLYQWVAAPIYHTRALQMRYARQMDVMAWAWLCTGDARIADRFGELEETAELVFERFIEHKTANHEWQTFGINSTNSRTVIPAFNIDRTMRGTTADPWQIGLAHGYYRAYQLTGRDFWLDLVTRITRTWATLFRFGRVLRSSRDVWTWRGPLWVSMRKLIYPGLNGNPGTYGSFPPASWYDESNQFTLWLAYPDNLWQTGMLAIAMRVHANERATYDRLFEVFSQDYVPWRDQTNVSIFDTRGEWFGDDALIPDIGNGFTIDAVVDAESTTEPDFELAIVGVGPDAIVVNASAEPQNDTESAFTLAFGDLAFDAVSETVNLAEPETSIDFSLGTLDIVVFAASETISVVDVDNGIDEFIVLHLDLGEYAAEVIEDSEEAASLYDEYAADSETVTVTEPGFVYDDGTRAQTSVTVRSSSGNATVRSLSGGNPIIRGKSG